WSNMGFSLKATLAAVVATWYQLGFRSWLAACPRAQAYLVSVPYLRSCPPPTSPPSSTSFPTKSYADHSI
ncbi:hypothetical protein FRC02_003949, partial [Tulasnella sp. 418]